MRIAFYTDPHLRSIGSYPPFNMIGSSGMSKELENMISGFIFVANTLRDNPVDYVFCLGDVFHEIDRIPNSVLYGASHAFEHINKIIPPSKHHILVGNHDLTSTRNMVNSIRVLKGYGTPWCNSDILHLTKDSENIKVGVIPYGSTAEVYGSIYKMKDDVDFIVTHSECSGSHMENDQEVKDGVPSKVGVQVFS